ncbi:MAG: HAMP domain-containing protein, partial [Verrucomicrobia bacterium]|nr:HAMP domain-containing protein [Verrucomicrobiota bacterium]
MQTFRYAVTELSFGYQHLFQDLQTAGFHPDPGFLADIKQQLQTEYQSGIMADLQKIKGPFSGFEQFADLSPEGLLLQYVYILKASSETGARLAEHALSEIAANQNLPSSFRIAFIKTGFARAMDRYHNLFESLVRRNNYLDFLLIDDKGNVIYSFDKSWDFGTNVFTGWRSASNLNRVFSMALFVPMSDRNTIDQVVITDMERYPAAYGAPMMFLGCPINNRLGGRLGVLVQKIPSSVFTALVSFEGHWLEVGLGKTGDAYLVGPDRKLRSEPRFRELMQDVMKSPSFSQEGQPLPATAILTSPLKNAAIESVFSSNQPHAGAITFFDELGRQSLGVYTRIYVSGLEWGLVITINTDEAFAPAAHLTWLVFLFGLVTIFVAVIGSLLFGHFLSLPIAQLVSAAEKISLGDNTARAQVSSHDEIGFLAERFNSMIDHVEERNRHVHKILETVNEALFLLDRSFAIQPGYSRMTREIFRRDIVGKNFLDLLRPDPNLLPVIPEGTLIATQSYLELLLNPKVKEKLVQQTNPLSEVEFQYVNAAGLQCSKFLDFRFNRIMDQGKTTQIMVTTVDSTSRISLKKEIRENEAKAESQITTLFGIMHVEPILLLHFLDNTKDEILGILRMLEQEQFGSNATETSAQRSGRYLRLVKRISRSIHLIKGNAAMLRLSYFENLANQLEEKLSVVRGNSSASGESFLPITTGLASFLDRVRMTRDLVDRLSS